MSSDPVVPLHTSATLHNTIRLLATRKAKSCQVSTHCAENSAVFCLGEHLYHGSLLREPSHMQKLFKQCDH